MRREIIRWVAIIVELVAVGVLLSGLLGNRHIITLGISRGALGMSLVSLGFTLILRTRWPDPSQINRASIVSMLPSILPFRLMAIGARWPVRWRLVANGAWGTLLLLSLTSIAAATFGDSVTALGLAAAVLGLNLFGSLLMMLAQFPADRRQG